MSPTAWTDATTSNTSSARNDSRFILLTKQLDSGGGVDFVPYIPHTSAAFAVDDATPIKIYESGDTLL